jgi:hypothetical protein
VRVSTFTAGIAAVAATTATAATVWAGGVFEGTPQSRPDFVTPDCATQRHAAACDVALRYLAALDLDRSGEACALLAPGTLDAAGGIGGCRNTLAAAEGIRIRYSLSEAVRASIGTTIRFTTQGESESPIEQAMLVSPEGRIIAVMPAMG